MKIAIVLFSILSFPIPSLWSFSIPSSSSSSGGGATTSIDRFRAICPAPIDAIEQYDSSLLLQENNNDDNNDDRIWVAVYRSSNNAPNVFLRDEFMNSMKLATTTQSTQSSSIFTTSNKNKDESATIELGINTRPIAVACLSPFGDNDVNNDDGRSRMMLMESMRCSLQKERTDPLCDGGSEHTEALGICIDELLLYYLGKLSSSSSSMSNNNNDDDEDDNDTDENDKENALFDGCIHCRATLVSGKLLEDRGFQPITSLNKHMTTHVSNFDQSMLRYADRAVMMNSSGRSRALSMVSFLGRMDRNQETKHLKEDESSSKKDDDDEDEEYDPWANIKKFI